MFLMFSLAALVLPVRYPGPPFTYITIREVFQSSPVEPVFPELSCPKEKMVFSRGKKKAKRNILKFIKSFDKMNRKVKRLKYYRHVFRHTFQNHQQN